MINSSLVIPKISYIVDAVPSIQLGFTNTIYCSPEDRPNFQTEPDAFGFCWIRLRTNWYLIASCSEVIPGYLALSPCHRHELSVKIGDLIEVDETNLSINSVPWIGGAKVVLAPSRKQQLNSDVGIEQVLKHSFLPGMIVTKNQLIEVSIGLVAVVMHFKTLIYADENETSLVGRIAGSTEWICTLHPGLLVKQFTADRTDTGKRSDVNITATTNGNHENPLHGTLIHINSAWLDTINDADLPHDERKQLIEFRIDQLQGELSELKDCKDDHVKRDRLSEEVAMLYQLQLTSEISLSKPTRTTAAGQDTAHAKAAVHCQIEEIMDESASMHEELIVQTRRPNSPNSQLYTQSEVVPANQVLSGTDTLSLNEFANDIMNVNFMDPSRKRFLSG